MRMQPTSWSGQPVFPASRVPTAAGASAWPDPPWIHRLGERVLVRTMEDPTIDSKEMPVTLGSEIDGAFAEYLAVRS